MTVSGTSSELAVDDDALSEYVRPQVTADVEDVIWMASWTSDVIPDSFTPENPARSLLELRTCAHAYMEWRVAG